MKRIFTLTIYFLFLLHQMSECLAQYAPTPFSPQLKFIENKGQWANDVHFVAEIPGGQLKLVNNQLNYDFYNTYSFAGKAHANHSNHSHASANSLARKNVNAHITKQSVKMRFSGANPKPKLVAKVPQTEIYNYYIGMNKEAWATGCKAYAEITYEELYPGIDLRLYSNQDFLKYDLVLKPGATTDQIKFSYDGLDKIGLDNEKLICQTKINTFIENKPYAYQINAKGSKKQVACEFELNGTEVSFNFPDGFDTNATLIIDPELIFSTFSGSTADNFGYTACFDDAGNLYSGGIVFGTGLPVTNGGTFNGGPYDIGILKYDSLGEKLLYATYLGGMAPDTPHSLIVNNNNELVILGTTGSADFPTTAGAYDQTFNGGNLMSIFGNFPQGSDITITKLDANGGLIASTLLGSPGNDGILKLSNINAYNNDLIQNYGDYVRGDIIVDEDDNIYVASSTDSTSFPTTSTIQPAYGGGNSDGVVFKLNTELTSLLWSTYFGGNQDDATFSIKLDQDNNVYVGGGSSSPDLLVTSGVLEENFLGTIDGFISKFDVDNDMVLASSYLGTPAYDQVYFIDLDAVGNVYALGQTRGSYTVTKGVYNNPNSAQFIHCLNNALDSTIFSTVFGSGSLEPNISPTAFLVNECDNIFLSGWGGVTNNSNSGNLGNTFGMPVTADALFPNTDGSDFYMMGLSADGTELLYATFFGGNNGPGAQDHVDGGTSRFDKRGIVYQSVCTCGGSADNFPTTPNAWSTVNRGVNVGGIERCNNAAFKFDLATLDARLQTDSRFRNEPGFNDGCAPLEVVFYNESLGGEEFFWDLGDGNTSTNPDSVVNIYQLPGTYEVTLRARDINTCTVEDVATTTITVYEDNFSIGPDREICGGTATQLIATGGVGYTWVDGDGMLISTEANPVVRPDSTTTYQLNVVDANGCVFDETLTVDVIPEVQADFTVNKLFNCESVAAIEIENNAINSESFVWDFGDGETSNEANPSHIYQNFGTYEIRLTAEAQGCTHIKTVPVTVEDFMVPNVITLNQDAKNEKFQLSTTDDINLSIFNRWGRKLFDAPAYKGDWPNKSINAGVYYYEATFPNGVGCNGWIHVIK